MHLMECFCFPILSYGLCLSNQQLKQLNIVLNVYRKAFKMHQWESVKELQWFCERLDFKHVVDERKLLFEGVIKVTKISCGYFFVYTLAGICLVVL